MTQKNKVRFNNTSVNRWLNKEGIGGQLMDEYKSTKYLQKWKCAFGHEYKAKFESIRGKWKRGIYPCSDCHPNQGRKLFREGQVRFAFEYLTGEKFVKTKPDWLINDITGNKLELDGYCKKLGLAFEYDGEQHDEHNKHFHTTKERFKDQQQRDALKDKLCKYNGVHLVRIKAKDDYLKNPRLIADRISEHSSKYLTFEEVDWDAYNSKVDFDLVTEAREHAEKNGGECRTEEIYDRKQKITFYCPEHNHEWENNLTFIKARNYLSWCKKCGYKKTADKNTLKFTSKELQVIAKSFHPKLKLREELGMNENGESLWECAKCKTLTPKKAKSLKLMSERNSKSTKDKLKHPCIQCNGKRRIQTWEMHQYAEKHGGECLHFEAELPKDKLIKFNCFNADHDPFDIKYSAVKNSRRDNIWCPRCRTSRNKRIDRRDIDELCDSRGFKLIGEYKDNTTKLTLECIREDCGAIKEDWNYRALKRSKSEVNYCDTCRDL